MKTKHFRSGLESYFIWWLRYQATKSERSAWYWKMKETRRAARQLGENARNTVDLIISNAYKEID